MRAALRSVLGGQKTFSSLRFDHGTVKLHNTTVISKSRGEMKNYQALSLSSCDPKPVCCLNWQDEDVTAHGSGLIQYFVLHCTPDYICFCSIKNVLTHQLSYPKVTATFTWWQNIVVKWCISVVLQNVWTPSHCFCGIFSLLIREKGIV